MDWHACRKIVTPGRGVAGSVPISKLLCLFPLAYSYCIRVMICFMITNEILGSEFSSCQTACHIHNCGAGYDLLYELHAYRCSGKDKDMYMGFGKTFLVVRRVVLTPRSDRTRSAGSQKAHLM